MKAIIFFILFTVLAVPTAFAQIKIGDNPQNIDASSVLELESTSKVLVITRVTTLEMEAITPQRGGMVYNTDTECINYYDGTQWVNLCDAVNFTITNDPIINGRSTIEITESAAGYNLEVAKNSILGDNIIDGGIGPDDIQDNSITQDKLAAESVGSSELRQNAVGSEEIRDGSIAPADIANFVPGQVLTTDENGIVQWEDTDGLFDLTFNKLDTTLTIARSTIAGVSTISLGALIGSDDQQLSLENNILSIENDPNTIDLSTYFQTLSINPATNQITLSNGNTINLPAAALEADGIVGNEILNATDGTLVRYGGGTDTNPYTLDVNAGGIDTEELANNAVTNIKLADNSVRTANILNGTISTLDIAPAAAAPANTQILSTSTTGVVGWINIPEGAAEVDGDIRNELQDIDFDPNSNILTISTPLTAGKVVDLSGLANGGGSGSSNLLMEVTVDSLVVQDTNGRVGVRLAELPASGSNNSLVEVENDSLIVQDAGGRLGILLSELGSANGGSNNAIVEIANDSLIVEDAGGRLGILLSELGGANGLMEVTTDSLVVQDGNGRIGVNLEELNVIGNNSLVEIQNDSLVIEDAGARLGVLLSELGGANLLMEVTTDSLVVEDGNGRIGVNLEELNVIGNNSLVEIQNDSLVIQDAGARLGVLLSELGGANLLMEVTTDSLVVEDGNSRIGVDLDEFTVIGSNNSAVEIMNDSLIVEDAGGRLGFLLSELGGVNTLMQVTTDSLVVDDGNGRVGVPLANLRSNGSNNSAVEIMNDSLIIEDAGGRLGFLISELGGTNELMQVTIDSLVLEDGNSRVGLNLNQLPNLANTDLTQNAGENRTFEIGENDALIFTGLGRIGIGNGAISPQNKLHVAGEVRSEGFNSSKGSEEFPAYSFSTDDDIDTGMYRIAADEIGFSVGGNLALTIDEPRKDITNVTVNGSFSTNIRTENGNGNILVAEDDYTLIIGNATSVELPLPANTGLGLNIGKIYILKNITGASITISQYSDSFGNNSNTFAPGILKLQSDGVLWHQIN